jgi:hypothetical protein
MLLRGRVVAFSIDCRVNARVEARAGEDREKPHDPAASRRRWSSRFGSESESELKTKIPSLSAMTDSSLSTEATPTNLVGHVICSEGTRQLRGSRGWRADDDEAPSITSRRPRRHPSSRNYSFRRVEVTPRGDTQLLTRACSCAASRRPFDFTSIVDDFEVVIDVVHRSKLGPPRMSRGCSLSARSAGRSAPLRALSVQRGRVHILTIPSTASGCLPPIPRSLRALVHPVVPHSLLPSLPRNLSSMRCHSCRITKVRATLLVQSNQQLWRWWTTSRPVNRCMIFGWA